MNTRRSRLRRRTTSLSLEPLEARLCLAWAVVLEGGTLKFTGTGAGEGLNNIVAEPGTGKVQYNGITTAIQESDVTAIHVFGDGGDDTIELEDGAVGFTNPIPFQIYGDGGDDTIYGPPITILFPSGHVLDGGNGDDTIFGGSGDDTINGGDNVDFDWIEGGDGADTIDGGTGPDQISGDAGEDIVYGGTGNDEIYGGSEKDLILGGPGNDTLKGNDGHDILWSNEPGMQDQPFRAGEMPNPMWNPMKGTGGPGCDTEEGRVECIPLVNNDGIYDVDPGVPFEVLGPGADGTPPYGIIANDDLDGDSDCGCPFDIGEFTINLGAVSGGNFTREVNAQGHHTGGFTYLYSGAAGTQTVEYTVTTEHGTSNTAVVTFNVRNLPPVANNDTYNATVSYGNNLTIASPGVLVNDTDPNNDGLMATEVGEESSGNAELALNGSFTFTPSQLGVATFTYVALDGVNSSNVATVTLNISNAAPTAVNDSYNAIAGSTLSVSSPGVLANDTDPDDAGFGALLQTGPSYADSFSLSPDGSFEYTPNMYFTGVDQFTYVAWDGWNYSNLATVTITVSAPIMLNAPAIDGSDADSITADDVRRFLLAAGERWHEAGVSRHIIDGALQNVTIVMADLPGSQLAAVAGSVLYVDSNAAGYGWFLDVTPESDREFARRLSLSEMHATADSPAYGQVDLLTTAMHEVGHLLGLGHSEGDGIMNDELGLGMRRVPTAYDAALVELLYLSGRRR